MTEDSLRDREIELMTYLRNTVTDPSSRGELQTDTFSGTGALATFTLTKVGVKNVVSVTVGGAARYIGYHYTVAYGEGTDSTIITFKTGYIPASAMNNVVIVYRYGHSMIYEGFQRDDAELPRIAIISSGITPSPMAIGEHMDGVSGRWIYKNASYVAEIRSRFAKQMKTIFNDFANKVDQYRQSTPQPYQTVWVGVTSQEPYDFDNELRIYRAIVRFNCNWMYKFKD